MGYIVYLIQKDGFFLQKGSNGCQASLKGDLGEVKCVTN